MILVAGSVKDQARFGVWDISCGFQERAFSMRTVATDAQSSCKGVYSASEKPLFKAWCFGVDRVHIQYHHWERKAVGLCVDGQRIRRCRTDRRGVSRRKKDFSHFVSEQCVRLQKNVQWSDLKMCRGTKEGDTLSSLLCNLVLRHAMEKILESRNLASQI